MADDRRTKVREAVRRAQADFEQEQGEIEDKAEQLRVRRRRAFEEAQAAGLSTRDIGEEAGLHFTRVAEILRGDQA